MLLYLVPSYLEEQRTELDAFDDVDDFDGLDSLLGSSEGK